MKMKKYLFFIAFTFVLFVVSGISFNRDSFGVARTAYASCTISSVSLNYFTSSSWASDCESSYRTGKYARYYSFTLSESRTVIINLVGSVDTYLNLFTGTLIAGSNLVASNDDCCGGTNSQISVSLPAGTYTVEATTYSSGATGNFNLAIDLASSCTISSVSLNYFTSSSWASDCESSYRTGKYARYYSFTLSESRTVIINLVGSVDTYLNLFTGTLIAGSNLVASNDDCCGGTNSQISVSLPAGTYTVEATTYSSGATGNFNLAIDASAVYTLTTSITGGGNISGNTCSSGCASGTSVTLTASPSSGYVFAGWSGDCSGTSVTCSVAMYSNKSVTANFTPTYTLTTSITGGGNISGNTCSSGCASGTSVTLTATPSSGYTFIGWSGACTNTSGPCYVTMNGNKTVTAKFISNPTTSAATNVTSSSVDLNGIIKADNNGLYYKWCLGTSCTVPVLFSGVADLAVGNNRSGLVPGTNYSYTLVIVNGSDTTLAASNATSFTTWNTFSVTKTGSGSGTVTAVGGINCGSTCSAGHPPGTIVFPQAAPVSGSVFTGWKSVEQGGDCPSVALCPIRMSNKNITATANFESSKTLTVNKTKDVAGTVISGPVGINCGISCESASKSYLHNTTVILKAFPSTSYNFSSWSGCDSSSGNSCTVNINSDKTVTVNFTLKTKFNLNITKSGKGKGYVMISKTGLSDIKCDFNEIKASSCAGKYANDGTPTVTLKAFSYSGSEFVNWGGDCVGQSYCSISRMDSDKNVTVYFNKIR